MENANAVDVNFGKLAAKGIAIMISSGDSGSGYVAPQCTFTSGVADIMVTKGTVKGEKNHTLLGCCEFAQVREEPSSPSAPWNVLCCAQVHSKL
jgi:hypothetical protein